MKPKVMSRRRLDGIARRLEGTICVDDLWAEAAGDLMQHMAAQKLVVDAAVALRDWGIPTALRDNSNDYAACVVDELLECIKAYHKDLANAK